MHSPYPPPPRPRTSADPVVSRLRRILLLLLSLYGTGFCLRPAAAQDPATGYALLALQWNSGRIQAQGTPVPYLRVTKWHDTFRDLQYTSDSDAGVAAFLSAIRRPQNWEFWADDATTTTDAASNSVAPTGAATLYHPYAITLSDTPGTRGLSAEFAVTVVFNTYRGHPPRDSKMLFRVHVPDKEGRPHWVTSYFNNGTRKTFTINALPQSAGIDADITKIKFPARTNRNDGTTTGTFNTEVPIGFHVKDAVNPYDPHLGWLARAVDVDLNTRGTLALLKDDVNAAGEAHLLFSRRLNPTEPRRTGSAGGPSPARYPAWAPDAIALDTVARSNEVGTKQFGGVGLRLDKSVLAGMLPGIGGAFDGWPGLNLSLEADSGHWWKKKPYTASDAQHASRDLLYYTGAVSTNHLALLPGVIVLNHDPHALPWERGLSLDGSFQYWYLPNEKAFGDFPARKHEQYRSITLRLPLSFVQVSHRTVGFSVTLQHGASIANNFADVDTHPQFGLFLYPRTSVP